MNTALLEEQMMIDPSQRIQGLPPYLFAEIDRKKKEAVAKGMDIISLGIGDPDQPTPGHIVQAAQKAVSHPPHHQYPLGSGLKSFRQAIVDWYIWRFRSGLDVNSEVNILIGSKEGIGHLALGVINPGDVAFVPEPSYPVYANSVAMAGGSIHYLPLTEQNHYLPDLDSIPKNVLKKAKVLYLNYPGNPTSAVAPESFFKKVVDWAKEHKILVAHDAAYSEMYYDDPTTSFLSTPGAKDIGIEFHTLSKTYNMTGWRLGWVCGNARAISILAQVKDNYDSGQFHALQEAGALALSGSQDCVVRMRALYRERRDIFVDGLKIQGWRVKRPPATFYVWARVPEGQTSVSTVEKLLEEQGIVCTPGTGFGPSGEGYVRFALTVGAERLKEALERMKKIRW